jgi:hypothetical protein
MFGGVMAFPGTVLRPRSGFLFLLKPASPAAGISDRFLGDKSGPWLLTKASVWLNTNPVLKPNSQ